MRVNQSQSAQEMRDYDSLVSVAYKRSLQKLNLLNPVSRIGKNTLFQDISKLKMSKSTHEHESGPT